MLLLDRLSSRQFPCFAGRHSYIARVTTPAGAAVAAPSPISRRPARHNRVLPVVVFLGALVASWAVLGRCLPFPAVPVVREKVEQLSHYGDEYDVLFIGSSRIYFQVLPSIFDQVAREHGLPLRSFNAGIAAMRPPEDDYYLEQILRRPHRRLRWVFVELMGLNANADPTLTATRRSSYWHDWSRTEMLTERCFHECAEAYRSATRHESTWREARQACENSLWSWLDNLWLFAERFSCFGRGEILLQRRFGSPKEKKKDISEKEGLAWDGWAFPSIAKPWTEDPKRFTAYNLAYANLLATEQRFDPEDPVSWKTLDAKLSRIKQAGATPILIIAPNLALKRYFPPEFSGKSASPAILDFSDPREHPELFAIDHRLDGQHLNYDGAVIFTEEIARRFLEVVKQGQKP